MNNKRSNRVVKMLVLVAFLGTQGVVLAGRFESSMEPSNQAGEPGKCLSSSKVTEQSQANLVHDNVTVDSAIGNANDAQLTDYLELHGRVVEGSIRSTMMPWSALQQVAN